MSDERYIKKSKQIALKILGQSNNCLDSQALFNAARTVPELAAAWIRYWDGVVHEVPAQVIAAFARHYKQYRADLNLAGLYYNEQPPQHVNNCIILVGDTVSMLRLTGQHRVYILGKSTVQCSGRLSVIVNSPDADVTLNDTARAVIEAGYIECFDRTSVVGKGTITCHDCATLNVTGGHVTDHGHLRITAFGDVTIDTFTRRGITLNGNAQLNLRQK